MGLGAAIAIELARRGADVAIAARNLGGPAEEVKAAVSASAPKNMTDQKLEVLYAWSHQCR